ncbi:hypothetical protein BDQ17DRAFT_1369810 [Cyathus striatus]|nr:hypothetical protein BDQ17DRAFT_1369810 [Cyathus striatus]
MYFTINIILLAYGVRAALAQQANCSSGLVSCGPRSTCCPSGTFCNFNRGIPVCEGSNSTAISGFDDSQCGGDPFLFDCSSTVDISGFCCPVGTICYNNGADSIVSCINAIGTTSAAMPTSTSMNFLPSASPVAEGDKALQVGPQSAWNTTSTSLDCNSGSTSLVTDVINATISLNFTGRGILINTVSSPNGGVFSMIFDGVPLMDTIDTYNADSERCYIRQFPPFEGAPADLALTLDHSLILMYSGPSKHAPNGSSSMVQFNSFAIPQFTTENTALRNGLNVHMLTPVLFVIGWTLLPI